MAELRWRRDIGPAEVIKLSVGPMDNNVYLLTVGDETLLIDGSNEADAILSSAEGRLTQIVQTHSHPDHLFALEDLVAATSAPVYCHPDDQGPVPVPCLDMPDTVAIGDLNLETVHTPGHTPGGVCFVARAGGQTHVFSGDTLFPGGPGGTFGDAEAFATIIRSLEEKLLVLPDDAFVYPGHGGDTTIGAERPSLPEWKARGY